MESIWNDMILVEGGTFTMGDISEQARNYIADEKNTHLVTVNSFYMSKYEITQKQWATVMGSNPSYFRGDNLPVEQVSWNDVQEFIAKLNEKTGRQYRLPTEAEWEYAARGGPKSKGYKYSGSNNLDDVGWYNRNSRFTTHPVGSLLPNELGLYDMSGNVWEWTKDSVGEYDTNLQTYILDAPDALLRSLRGGSWYNEMFSSRVLKSTFFSPDRCGNRIGFRLVSVP